MFSSMFILFGLLDNGTTIGVTNRNQSYALYHQKLSFKDETYTFDGGQVNVPVVSNKHYFLSLGLKIGVETHADSKYFDDMYAVESPVITLGSKYKTYNVALSVDIGKGFQTISSHDTGQDRHGYTSRTSAMLSFSVNLNSLNEEGKDESVKKPSARDSSKRMRSTRGK